MIVLGVTLRWCSTPRIHIFPLTCSAIYPFRSFWCELMSFGGISRTDVCLLYSIMELDCTQFVVLKVPKNTLKWFNSNVSLVAQYNKPTLFGAVSCTIFFLLNYTLLAEGRVYLLMDDVYSSPTVSCNATWLSWLTYLAFRPLVNAHFLLHCYMVLFGRRTVPLNVHRCIWTVFFSVIAVKQVH